MMKNKYIIQNNEQSKQLVGKQIIVKISNRR